MAPIQAQRLKLEQLFQGSADRPPAMRSVFWNTVLGSIWGGTLGATIIQSKAPTHKKVLTGASIGGVIGYGIGLILVIQGITFDPENLPSFRLVKSHELMETQVQTRFVQVEWTLLRQKF